MFWWFVGLAAGCCDVHVVVDFVGVGVSCDGSVWLVCVGVGPGVAELV